MSAILLLAGTLVLLAGLRFILLDQCVPGAIGLVAGLAVLGLAVHEAQRGEVQ